MIFEISRFVLNIFPFYCTFTCNKCEVCCGVNHSALLHCEYRVGILHCDEGTENVLTTRTFKSQFRLPLISSIFEHWNMSQGEGLQKTNRRQTIYLLHVMFLNQKKTKKMFNSSTP